MLRWSDTDIKDQIKKTAESLPMKTWASLSEHSPNIYHGCFRGEPNNVAKFLERPSAPKPGRKVVWPERLRCIEFKTMRKSTLSHSRSFDNITVTHC